MLKFVIYGHIQTVLNIFYLFLGLRTNEWSFLILYKWCKVIICFVHCSVTVVFDSLRSHGLQGTRLPCPSPSPRTCSSSCPSRWCHPTISSSIVPFSSCLQSFTIRVFSSESFLPIRWPKDWSFSFSISLSNEYSGLISFRIDWLDLLAVQGTLNSLLQHHSSKASIILLVRTRSHGHIWLQRSLGNNF